MARAEASQASRPDSGLLRWQKLACRVISAGPLPLHVAFIMDGNRRWARQRGLEIAQGHRLGYYKLEETLRWCAELDIRAVTCYAFSIENFKRTQEEVGALMRLAVEKLSEMCCDGSIIMQQRVRVRVVGDLARVPENVREQMESVMARTALHDRAVLTICFSYTSRHEIASAVAALAAKCSSGKLEPEDVCAPVLETAFCTHDDHAPPVDLLIRTSGEKRLSDFLLWQSADALTFFTPVRWPELSLLRFLFILLRYQLSKPCLDAICLPSRAPPESSAFCLDASVVSGSTARGAHPSLTTFGVRHFQTLLAAVAAVAFSSAIALRTADRFQLAVACLVAAVSCAIAWIIVAVSLGGGNKGGQHAFVSFAASALAAATIAVAAHRAISAVVES